VRFLFLLLAVPAFAAEPLPALHADTVFTVSGLSSGAYMAVQIHVAHSSRVKGIGAIAGGPYYCAQGSLWTAYYNCMTPGTWWPLPSSSALQAQTDALAKAGQIDATAHLASARAWLFSGTQDRTVLPPVVHALKSFYEGFKAKPVLVADKPAGHAMVTEDRGNACPTTAAPYINDCDYDAAGELLRHLLGSLSAPGAPGRLIAFDQHEFSLKGTGLLFIPAACEKERCRVHVAFHGCRQSAKEFAEGAGYNRWAGGNRLVVLYPHIEAGWWPYNPRGCWDWWGYTGAQYATKEGAQIRAVMQMVERLSAPRQ
jgi:poly(3-hydroxybutyrate) depolymerase